MGATVLTLDAAREGLPPALVEQEELYEQISGGCLREVRSNVTVPAGESNLAVLGLMNTSVPSW